ncbi:MAG: glycosyltransferase family 4 protein [Anaerolineae bacterium]|jgi:glycosyltransferase involved in cell wall biosynthesis
MRILQVVHQYPPERIGGTELYTLALARGMTHRGHQVAVFHRAPGEPGLTLSDWQDMPTYRACNGEMTSISLYRSSFGDVTLSKAFARAVKDFEPDLIHLQHLKGLPTSIVQSAHDGRMPLLTTLHDYWPVCANAQLLTNYDQTICEGPRNGCINCARCAVAMLDNPASALALPMLAALMTWRNFLLERALHDVEVMIAPTAFVRRWFVTRGWPEDRIEVIPHGIEPPTGDRGRTPGKDQRLHVMYIGGLAWQKGVHTLVEACNGLHGAQLSIAGDEAFDPAYVSHLRSLASPNVQFLGQLGRERVWATLAQADVVAVPSLWYETFSLILHESFAAGTPVVASDLGALGEAVRDGVDGWLVAPGDVGAWRQTMGRLADEPSLLNDARANIRPPMTQEDHLDRIEDLYSRALAAHGGVQ